MVGIIGMLLFLGAIGLVFVVAGLLINDDDE